MDTKQRANKSNTVRVICDSFSFKVKHEIVTSIHGKNKPFKTHGNISIAKVDIHTQRSCCYDINNSN